MATAIPIPLTTISAGTNITSDVAIPQGVTTMDVSLDRSAGGFPIAGQPAVTIIHAELWESVDGGASYAFRCGSDFQGGPITNPRTGLPAQASWGCRTISDPQNPNRKARFVVQVPGTSDVSIQGTLTLSSPTLG